MSTIFMTPTVYVADVDKFVVEANRLDADATRCVAMEMGVAIVGDDETSLCPRMRAYLAPNGEAFYYPLVVEMTPGYMPRDYPTYQPVEGEAQTLTDEGVLLRLQEALAAGRAEGRRDDATRLAAQPGIMAGEGLDD